MQSRHRSTYSAVQNAKRLAKIKNDKGANEWVTEWKNEQIKEWLSEWMNGWVSKWTDEWMNGSIKCVGKWIDDLNHLDIEIHPGQKQFPVDVGAVHQHLDLFGRQAPLLRSCRGSSKHSTNNKRECWSSSNQQARWYRQVTTRNIETTNEFSITDLDKKKGLSYRNQYRQYIRQAVSRPE